MSPRDKVTYNVEYYILGQLSKFVAPGAYRVDSNTFSGGEIEDVAFQNPDGSIALFVLNSANTPQNFAVSWKNTSL